MVEIQKLPKVKNITDADHQLNYCARLSKITDEAENLYAFCIQKRFTKEQLSACIEKFRGPKNVSKFFFDYSKKLVFYLILLVAVSYVCYNHPIISEQIIIHARLFSIMFLLPYWDWASLYHETCLIDNPFIVEEAETIDKKFCQYCFNSKNESVQLQKLIFSSGADFESFISRAEPVIVTDVTKDWENKLTMEQIGKLYQHNSILSTLMTSCPYEVNSFTNQSFYNFIGAFVNKELPKNWHAQWYNCEEKASKVFRKYCPRPYFLPHMIQVSPYFSFIAAHGVQTEKWFSIEGDDNQGAFLTVLEGHMNILLTPSKACIDHFDCTKRKFNLEARETVFFVTKKWNLSYQPSTEQQLLAVSSTLIWDEQ